MSEAKELLKAWLAVSAAFAILLRGAGLLNAFLTALLTVGSGFAFHELAHKAVAKAKGYDSEFKADNNMLVFAVLSAFLGFVFAAPGGVLIKGIPSKKDHGLIALAGPLTNLLLALLFKAVSLGSVSRYGALINAWLALFNSIPLWNLDGAKVLAWSKTSFALLITASFLTYTLA